MNGPFEARKHDEGNGVVRIAVYGEIDHDVGEALLLGVGFEVVQHRTDELTRRRPTRTRTRHHGSELGAVFGDGPGDGSRIATDLDDTINRHVGQPVGRRHAGSTRSGR